MNIELKNIKHHAALSEETNAFSASLYIDGKKAGTAENTGKGGQTLVRAYGENRDIVRKAEDYCRDLPPRTTTLFNGEKMDLPMSLDFHIDTLVEDDLNYQHLKKKMRSNILVKEDDGKVMGCAVTSPVTKERKAKVIKQLELRGEKVLSNLPKKELLKEVYGDD